MGNSITDKALAYREFIQREESFVRAAYNPEVEFYTYITSGDLTMVDRLTADNWLDKQEGWGVLSDNKLQNLKYHFVITTAVIARYCINNGMALQTAYNLSDYYIRLADRSSLYETIARIHRDMCLDYTKRMRELQKERVCSAHIIRCVDYIYDNLHTRITLKNLCDITGLSRSYLSKLFLKEMGVHAGDYINEKKIETACNMLRFSDYPAADIAAILAFPSQSYFTEVFKKKTGLTPLAYRNSYSG